MDRVVLVIGQKTFTLLQMGIAAASLVLFLLVLIAVLIWRSARARQADATISAERQGEIDDKMAELNAAHAELTGRLRQLGEVLTSRQSELARVLSERLDTVGQRVGQGLEASGRSTSETLARLGERLAVIDAAQARLTGLTQEVVGLKEILANKQSRGAFGQGRMEAIVRDGLAAGAYEFQSTLPNNTRPDCIIRLPGDDRVLAIDAKFPLEAFAALREATDENARRQGEQRARNDIGRHVRDVSEKYLVGGVTQDIALLFVPSESIYADIHERFEDVVQKAHRARVIFVSPSLLMLAIQMLQTMVRDRRTQEQAHLIQREVRSLLDDVRRLAERIGKLDQHFRQAQDDVSQIVISVDKLTRRGAKIDQLEFADLSGAAKEPPAQRAAE